MKRFYFLVTAVFLAAVLCGCDLAAYPQPDKSDTQPDAQASTATEDLSVDIGGTRVEPDVQELDLTVLDHTLDGLIGVADRLTGVTDIQLGQTTLTREEMDTLAAAFPNATLHYTVSLFGSELAPDTQSLDLWDMDVTKTDELVAVLPLLPSLESINFVSDEGVCAYSLETIQELDKVRQVAPEVSLRVSFELFGQTVTSEDERIEYYLVDIGNEGAETVRQVLPYLESCEYLLMDGCGVDNEVMAQLREDFPETKVVWRVWLTKPDYNSPRMLRCAGFLTDTHRIRTLLVNDDNCDLLKYCTETKYVDFGHNEYISDFSFLAYMPDLEAAIIGLTHCNDLTPLMNCTKLEYLEVYGSKVTDLSPLAACTSLKHLNVSRLEVDDMTCLYGLELERFRAVLTDIPQEQIDEYSRLHPDCQMLMEGWAPHQNGWRYDDDGNKVERYALLQEQMEYAIDRQYGIQ